MTNHNTAWLTSFGGVCQGMFEMDIPPGYFKSALNYEIAKNGGLLPRQGMDMLSHTPDGEKVLRVESLDWDGSIRIFVATPWHVYEFKFDASGDPEWTEIYEFEEESQKVTFALLNATTKPFLVFGNGKDPMQIFEGWYHINLIDNMSNELSDAPIGFPIEFQNYIAVYGIPGHPGRVQFTVNPGDPYEWKYGGIIRSIETEGTVTAVFNYIGLVIFSRDRARIFHGDPSAPQGVLPLSDVVGCVSQNSIIEAEGRLFWLSRHGVSFWNGAGAFPSGSLSDREGERISNISEDMSRVDWSMSDRFCACYHPYTRQLFFSVKIIPLDHSERLSRTYVYDLGRRAWFPWSLECRSISILTANIKNVTPAGTTFTPRNIMLIGTEDGTLGILGEGSPQIMLRDETVTGEDEYEFHLVSGSSDFGDSNIDKTFRAVMLRVWRQNTPGMDGVRRVNLSFNGDFRPAPAGNSALRCPFDFVLGLSVVGDPLSINFPTEVRQPLALRAKYLSWEIRGQGNINGVVLSGIGLSVRPNSRRDGLVWQNNLKWQSATTP